MLSSKPDTRIRHKDSIAHYFYKSNVLIQVKYSKNTAECQTYADENGLELTMEKKV